jgi:hypothetical protein
MSFALAALFVAGISLAILIVTVAWWTESDDE